MNISIIHNPLGLENPYDQGPDERVPRFPEKGQKVNINWLVSPDTEGLDARVTILPEDDKARPSETIKKSRLSVLLILLTDGFMRTPLQFALHCKKEPTQS